MRRCGLQIALQAGVSLVTVSRMPRKSSLSQLLYLEPAQPVLRCVSEHPGDLIHLDIKTLGRLDSVDYRFSGYRKGRSKSEGVGWEYVNVGIEDAPHISFTISSPKKR